MGKYIIGYDYGYGMNYDIIEESSLEAAKQYAYEEWKEGAESNADYWAKEYSEEIAEEYGV